MCEGPNIYYEYQQLLMQRYTNNPLYKEDNQPGEGCLCAWISPLVHWFLFTISTDLTSLLFDDQYLIVTGTVLRSG